jgi:PST family polysaccharide transporter
MIQRRLFRLLEHEPSMSERLRRQAVGALAWSFVQTWGSRVLTFLIFLVLARLLTPADFGVVAMVTVTILAIYGLIDHGLPDALVQRENIEELHYDSAFWAVQASAAGTFILLCALAPVAANGLHQPSLVTLVPLMALSVPLGALGLIHEAQLRRRLEFRAIALRSLLTVVAGGLVAIGMALEGYGYWSLAAKAVVESTVSVGLLWHLNRWRPRRHFSRDHWRELFSVGRHLLGGRLLELVNQRADSLLIGWRLGAYQLGLYSVGQRVFQLLMDASFATIQQVALPVYARLQSDRERVVAAFLRTTRVAGCLAFPVFALIAASAGDLVIVLFGAKWIEAVPIVTIFAIGGVLFCIGYFNGSLLIAMGRADLYLRMSFVNAVCNLIGFAIGLQWGAVGVAAAFVIRGYLVYPIGLHYLRNTIGLRLADYGRSVGPFLLCAAGSVAVAILVRQQLLSSESHLHGLILTCSVGIGLYGAFCLLFARPALIAVMKEIEAMHPRIPRLSNRLLPNLRDE